MGHFFTFIQDKEHVKKNPKFTSSSESKAPASRLKPKESGCLIEVISPTEANQVQSGTKEAKCYQWRLDNLRYPMHLRYYWAELSL